jgi:molybdopterin-guanine dinucleotide biosynthesis protein
MRIIQISGRGRVGKTTLAHLIAQESFKKGFIPVVLPFAKAIKDTAASMGFTKEVDSSQYRKFCQELGASKRAENEDYWVTQTFAQIQDYMVKELDNKKQNKTHWEYVIIQDDVRYMNELALGRDLVATQLFLDADSRKLEENNAEWRNHESEILANKTEESLSQTKSDYIDLFDFVISNGSSLNDLQQIVKEDIKDWLELGFLELEEVPDDAE